jgi:antitoxin VapB
MALNIKNPEADRLARELAQVTGLSITDALVAALEEKLARERDRAARYPVVRQIQRIRERYRELPVLDERSADDVIGYDEQGLPG